MGTDTVLLQKPYKFLLSESVNGVELGQVQHFSRVPPQQYCR